MNLQTLRPLRKAVLDTTENLESIRMYAELLSLPIELGMFMPVYENSSGVVAHEKPEMYETLVRNPSSDPSMMSAMGQVRAYQRSMENILFPDFKVVRKGPSAGNGYYYHLETGMGARMTIHCGLYNFGASGEFVRIVEDLAAQGVRYNEDAMKYWAAE